MKRDRFLLGASALAMMFGASPAVASDHWDSPSVIANPPADITDLYTWVDGANTVLILNTLPNATAASVFSNAIQYVIHTESTMAFGMTGTPQNIICTFTGGTPADAGTSDGGGTGGSSTTDAGAPGGPQTISCWVGTADYVTGDASATGGITSASGDVKVFAGLRDDPFFFNLAGFQAVQTTVESNASIFSFNAQGCPSIGSQESQALIHLIGSNPDGQGAPPQDYFSPSASYSGNVLSIVLSIKTSLLTSGGPILAVWASTNEAM